jgi:hypothetical protein
VNISTSDHSSPDSCQTCNFSRREFLQLLAAGAGVAIIGGCGSGGESTSATELGTSYRPIPALLGTTFIAVVAINIGQTARQEERDKARSAAQAGLQFLNNQLTNSTSATKWRPELEVVRYNGVDAGAPAIDALGAKDPDYDIYWTTLDQAQGWARGNSLATGTYVKFPDPRSTNQNITAANFLAKIEKVVSGDVDNANGDKTGALRISVVGFSPDDQNAFYKLVAYKAGPAQMPGTSAMRTVSNYDWANATVPLAEVASSGSPTSLTVANQQGSWPSTPFYIMRGDPLNGGNAQGHIVTAVAGSTLTLSSLTPISGSAVTGERVELAAALGAPSALDYDNDGATDATNERVDFKLSQASTPGSALTNGGLIWYGNAFSQNLRATSVATATQIPGAVRASGLIDSQGTVNVSGTYDGTTTVSGTLEDSGNANFPFSGGSGTVSQKLLLVEDGANRLAGNTETERQIRPFTPPDMTSGGEGFGRYRQLTKFSEPANSGDPAQASAYGWGKGIYINNPQDKERVYSGSGLREMTQSEFRDLLFSSSATANYARLGTPLAQSIANASLEQQHLRGWIGPDEFLPRGALVELNDNGTLNITLDPRADGISEDTNSNNVLDTGEDTNNNLRLDKNNQGPQWSKGWYDVSGTLYGDSSAGGVYTFTNIPWPANGVLFAEGNIRIRGSATNAPRSLTVVSMNNIYIEGSLGAGTSARVLLVAKKNVVVNPTRVIQRADAQTLTSGSASGVSVPVYDGSSFRPGDWITLATGSGTELRMVATASASNLQLTEALAGTANTGAIVRTVSDPVDASNLPYVNYANRLDNFNQALLRRVNLPASTSNARLAFRHSAERRDGLEVEYVASPDPNGNAWGVYRITRAELANKLAQNATTSIVQSTEKLLSISYDAGSGIDNFPGTAPADQAAALAYNLNQLASDIDTRNDTVIGSDSNPHSREWKYDGTVLNTYDGNTPVPPYFSLAAVGNRYDFDATPPVGSFAWRKTFFAEPYKIPMATSVVLSTGNSSGYSTQATLTSDTRDAGNTAFEQVSQFGFSYYHGAAEATQNAAWEDVTTVDQSFYRNGHKGDATAGDNTYYTLDTRTVGAGSGWNSIALRMNPLVASFFNQGTDAKIPFYRLSRVKLENSNQLNGTNEFETITPATTFDISAYVYAQEGSWLIIPGSYYDQNVRRTHVNLPHNAAATQDADENLDLNRDGSVSRGEQAAVFRFYRYNYQINFTGAIMENNTAVVQDPDGSGAAYGEVSEWTDKWATVKVVQNTDLNSNGTPENNWTGNTAGDTLQNNLSTDAGNYGTINYSYDARAAIGALDNDDGFHPPITSELMFQTS